MATERVIFFDGVCGLCNRAVDRLIKIDKYQRLRFAPLQGTTAETTLPIEHQLLESMVYMRNGTVYTRSTAAIKVLVDIGGWRKVNGVFYIIPRFIRDWVYNWVAKNRYKWFGKKSVCRLPMPFEKHLFLP